MQLELYNPDTDTDFVDFCREMIRRSYFPAYSEEVMGMFLQYHSAQNIAEDARRGRIWCARQGGELIGTATVAAGEISRVFVAPQARGTGLGRLLTRTALDYARESGLASITSWSVPWARRFYEKFGFAMVNADMLNFDDTREPPVPYIEMALRLDGGPTVSIEPAAPDDAQEIIAGAHVLKAVCGGQIIGSVRGARHEGIGEVARLYVHPAHRGRGAARMLMAAVEESMGDCHVYSLFTGERSQKNLALYARQGYAPTGERRPARDIDPYDPVWLEKPNPWPRIKACAGRFVSV